MRYAVIQTGGKQYRVSEGDVITIERLPIDEQAEFVCPNVLLYQNEGDLLLGEPFIPNFMVIGTVMAHTKGDKIRIGKYKAKVRFRRVTGHRQSLSKVQITRIGESKAVKAVKSEGTKDEQIVKKSTRAAQTTA